MLASRTLHISIDKSYDHVYDFTHQPQNFDKWVGGLATGLHPRPDGSWVTETPQGHLEITFSPPNGYGILDHTVYLPTGPVYVPLRLIKNGVGCDVVWTLFRRDEVTEVEFAAELATVARYLGKLKKLMEDGSESVVHVDFNSSRK